LDGQNYTCQKGQGTERGFLRFDTGEAYSDDKGTSVSRKMLQSQSMGMGSLIEHYLNNIRVVRNRTGISASYLISLGSV